MVLPVGALAVGGGVTGLLGWLANRGDEKEAQELLGVLERGAVAGLEGPPLPLEMQERRGTALISPQQRAVALTMRDPRERRRFLLGSAQPAIEAERTFQAGQRELARRNAMLQPENRVLAQAQALDAGETTFQTLDEDLGIVLDVPTTSSPEWQEGVDVLEGSVRGLEGVLGMAQGVGELIAEGYGTAQFIDQGDPRVAAITAQAATLVLALRQAFQTGQLDEGTFNLFAALGLDLNRTAMENVGDFVRILQQNPEAQLARLVELGNTLSDRLASAEFQTRFFQGINPAMRQRAAQVRETFGQLSGAGIRRGRTTPYQELLRSGGLQNILGLGLSMVPGLSDEAAAGIVEATVGAVNDSGRDPNEPPPPPGPVGPPSFLQQLFRSNPDPRVRDANRRIPKSPLPF